MKVMLFSLHKIWLLTHFVMDCCDLSVSLHTASADAFPASLSLFRAMNQKFDRKNQLTCSWRAKCSFDNCTVLGKRSDLKSNLSISGPPFSYKRKKILLHSQTCILNPWGARHNFKIGTRFWGLSGLWYVIAICLWNKIIFSAHKYI